MTSTLSPRNPRTPRSLAASPTLKGGAPTILKFNATNEVNQDYICVYGGGVNVRKGPELNSPIAGSLNRGDVVHGVMTCLSTDGSLRLKLQAGREAGWTSMRDKESNIECLRPALRIDQWYMCICPLLAVQAEVEPVKGAPVVAWIREGDVVHGILTCHNPDGSHRLQLDNGSWTCIRTEGEQCLAKATIVDQWYMRVSAHGGVLRVRSGLELSTPEVGTIELDGLVHGVLTLASSDGSLRVKLDNGSWTTLVDREKHECLRRVTRGERQYVCVVGSGVNVRKGCELSSPFIRTITKGEVVHGVLTCRGHDGSLRLKLVDGSWASVKDKDGYEGLRAVEDPDSWYHSVWPLGGIMGKS